MRLWRKYFSSMRPGSSSPTTPTGRTFTPRSARLLAALAAPPGTTLRSRCFRISTGASRETREISPKTNSSATRSPKTVTVILGKASTIFLRRSPSFGCLVIRISEGGAGAIAGWREVTLAALPGCATKSILSCAPLSFFNHAQNSIQSVSCVVQLHADGNHRQRLQRGKIWPQIDGIFLGSNKASGLATFPQVDQFTDILLGVRVVVAIKRFGYRIDVCRSQLQNEILRSRDP